MKIVTMFSMCLFIAVAAYGGLSEGGIPIVLTTPKRSEFSSSTENTSEVFSIPLRSTTTSDAPKDDEGNTASTKRTPSPKGTLTTSPPITKSPETDCDSKPCENGGTCLDTTDENDAPTSKCFCGLRFYGLHCEFSTTSESGEFSPSIVNTSDDFSMTLSSTTTSDALKDEEGNSASTKRTTKPDTTLMTARPTSEPLLDMNCRSHPCKNGGTCYDNKDYENDRNYICICDTTFDGLHCEIDKRTLNNETAIPTASLTTSSSSVHATVTNSRPASSTENKSSQENLRTVSEAFSSGKREESSSTENSTTSRLTSTSSTKTDFSSSDEVESTSIAETTNSSNTSSSIPHTTATKLPPITSSTKGTEFSEAIIPETSTIPKTSGFASSTISALASVDTSTPSSLANKQVTVSEFNTKTSTGTTHTSEDHSEITVACSPNPCNNGGMCFSNASAAAGYVCNCTGNYNGPNCASITSKNGKLSVAIYAGIIGVVSLLLVLVLMGGIIYSKKFWERKKRTLLYDNGESSSNRSSSSFA